MKYVKSKLYWTEEGARGFDQALAAKGVSASGGFYQNNDNRSWLISYLPDQVNLEAFADLEVFEISEISMQQALDLARELQPNAEIDDSGFIVFPHERIDN